MCLQDIRIAERLTYRRFQVAAGAGEEKRILPVNGSRITAVVGTYDQLTDQFMSSTSGTIDTVTGAVATTTIGTLPGALWYLGWMDGIQFVPLASMGPSAGIVTLKFVELGDVVRGELWIKNMFSGTFVFQGTDVFLRESLEGV